MSTNRNIVEMVEAIRKGTGGSNSADGVDGTYMADVLSVKPLTIKMHNTTITKNLYTMLSDTKCKYECELKESELPGAAISEIGLYDADGDIVTIKRFTAKGKDADISMTFYINDTF